MNKRKIILPKCVGFIMDGNRRWAKEKGLESLAGHKAGEEIFYDSVKWVQEAKIPNAVYYAFSTENWGRSSEEVSYIMELFKAFLNRMLQEIHQIKIGVRVIGRRADFSLELQQLMAKLEMESKKYTNTTISVALSYGGRLEIIEAVNKVVKEGQEVNEESFSNKLWTAGMPDPDLVIRTGGEQRLSNFLPWQTIYSELFFIDTYWPAFTKSEFTRILKEYGTRDRRKGK
jgi:undecaprenyl diphosphate synthase